MLQRGSYGLPVLSPSNNFAASEADHFSDLATEMLPDIATAKKFCSLIKLCRETSKCLFLQINMAPALKNFKTADVLKVQKMHLLHIIQLTRHQKNK